jgi:hypothetical protein
MRKIISILIIFGFIYSSSSKAAVIIPLKDRIPVKPHKISQDQFLDRSLTIGSMLIFGTLLLGSFLDLLKFSRKKLLNTLDNYFSGKGIPSGLKKNLYKKR